MVRAFAPAACAVVLALSLAASAGGKGNDRPVVSSVSPSSVQPGQTVVIKGHALDGARAVFLGGKGRGDDSKAGAQKSSSSRLVVTVPARAQSGQLEVRHGRLVAKRAPRVEVSGEGSANACSARDEDDQGGDDSPVAGPSPDDDGCEDSAETVGEGVAEVDDDN